MSDLETNGKLDQAKGKVKEAAGKLFNDKSTEAEGKLDQVKGSIKEKAGEAARNIKNALDKDKK